MDKYNLDQEPYPALYCYECGVQLRDGKGKELHEVHTASNMEDVCEDCCDVCAADEEEGVEEHDELIECPQCEEYEYATVEHTVPFYSYVHTCSSCGYIIMESEWQVVEEYDTHGLWDGAEAVSIW